MSPCLRFCFVACSRDLKARSKRILCMTDRQTDRITRKVRYVPLMCLSLMFASPSLLLSSPSRDALALPLTSPLPLPLFDHLPPPLCSALLSSPLLSCFVLSSPGTLPCRFFHLPAPRARSRGLERNGHLERVPPWQWQWQWQGRGRGEEHGHCCR